MIFEINRFRVWNFGDIEMNEKVYFDFRVSLGRFGVILLGKVEI